MSVPASFGTFLAEINHTPLLSASEEKELATRVREGDVEARDHMVRANLRLVINIARGYAGRGLALDDLVSEGTMGLLRAVEGFDPSMNTRFSTYAAYWIKQSLKRAVVNTAKTIRVPTYMAELLTKWRRSTHKLTDELGRAPTHDEVAKFLGLSKKKLAVIKAALRVASAGAQAESGDIGWSLEEAVPDHRSGPGAALGASDDLAQVLQLLKQMDQREAAVLRMRFGLGGAEPMTLKQIGANLGLTRERIRQIEGEALAKLADALGTDEGPRPHRDAATGR